MAAEGSGDARSGGGWLLRQVAELHRGIGRAAWSGLKREKLVEPEKLTSGCC